MYSKVITLDRRPDTGEVVNVTEETIQHENAQPRNMAYEPFKLLTEAQMGDRVVRIPLYEGLLNTPGAANILRNDLRYLAFSTFADMPRTFEGFTTMVDSNMPQEEYLLDAAIGVIPRVKSGDSSPYLMSDFESGVLIKNYQHRGRVQILGDWLRFDQIGKIRQVGVELGKAGRMTEEDEVYKYLTTTGNYTRNSTTGDNDIGANQQTLTFTPTTLDTGLTIISTSKDRKSGNYLGYAADTFVCGPRLEMAAKQFFMSENLVRTHGNTTIETRGYGEFNPYRGLISKMVVSPWFGASYQWALADSRAQGFMYQQVEPFNVTQQTQIADNQNWLEFDAIEYGISGFFGVGFVDDRAWFYSPSVTAPTGF